MFQSDLLKGKRILVTGGGSGLGKKISAKYLQLGADVYICGRRESVLAETANELMSQYGGTVKYHDIDIRSAQAVDDMVEAIWQDGPLTGLVNNAAGNFVSRTEDLSSRGFDAIANIVLHGTFYVTQSVGKRWISGGHRGSVVSILVTWVFNGGPFVVPSSMSKAGVNVMTRSLAVEWGRYGIRLNAIAPGVFPTDGMSKRLYPGRPDAGRTEGSSPMGRAGEMHELQNLATFLMADGCEWLTGQTLTIDGANSLATGGNFYHFKDWTDEDWAQARDSIRELNDRDRAARTA
ncbi:SDR family oxidoreductase [Paraburkholderia sp. J12]|uniref:SDR family oxidoreductase n=1 Tax=Paraburkholderia sp. J12 TaxID=2805432 RepID=UPI002ABE1666|nr:SDR family oxidoreductase [Paraburkholderia sp. J12]